MARSVTRATRLEFAAWRAPSASTPAEPAALDWPRAIADFSKPATASRQLLQMMSVFWHVTRTDEGATNEW